MRHRGHAVLLALFSVLLAALPALAHHSFTAEFNPDKEFTVTGMLTKKPARWRLGGAREILRARTAAPACTEETGGSGNSLP